ncbi:flagellar basal body-associated FliL family protein [Alterisphingorhabdus coralli]|uniref:Flagellar protein FliL n=1 Tax=Alterisphingorhabdus coralli TaxID=3071408 RepID=A0AA97F5U0_9SPHN|nr:flagellar basal body-associated FliL family protein [Parasphingorhabdus sp. SCSIO 66989]WOE74771.1 flagellar basal body-associated FliL family protein [Parasphingorhabdus sp. SCSIO 66989]
MADSNNAEQQADEAPKKGGKMKKVIMLVLGITLVGGVSAAGGFYFAGGAAEQGPKKPELPKLVLKDGTEVESDSTKSATIDPKELQVTYHQMENAFTTNLYGGGFAQAEIAVSTPYDKRVIDAIEEHDIAVRSAIVMKLAAGDSATLETLDGKKAMAGELKEVINETLREKTGFGGVDQVYFTKFVVQ